MDGIIVSNHGGRQLDRAISWIDAFPFIKAAVGEKAEMMLDGDSSRLRYRDRALPRGPVRFRGPRHALWRGRRRARRDQEGAGYIYP